MTIHIDKAVAWKQEQGHKDTCKLIGNGLHHSYFTKKHTKPNFSNGFSTWKNRLLNQGLFKVIHTGKTDQKAIVQKINELDYIDDEIQLLNNFNESIELVGLTLSAIQEKSKIFKNKFKVTILIENVEEE